MAAQCIRNLSMTVWAGTHIRDALITAKRLADSEGVPVILTFQEREITVNAYVLLTALEDSWWNVREVGP